MTEMAQTDCSSVSFDGQGGWVAAVVCSADDSGAIPAGPAGAGLIALGGAVYVTRESSPILR